MEVGFELGSSVWSTHIFAHGFFMLVLATADAVFGGKHMSSQPDKTVQLPALPRSQEPVGGPAQCPFWAPHSDLQAAVGRVELRAPRHVLKTNPGASGCELRGNKAMADVIH